MFRLFLRKKILSGPTKPAKGRGRKKAAQAAAPEAPRRNRRIFERYNVDHKHLTLMNEQDILLVREISAKGFSTEVSPRGFERLTTGDVYDARIRYSGEIYALQARVTWKEGTQVGFEIVKSDRDTLFFLKRLLRPIEIAASLKPVETSFMSEGNLGKSWYHGDEDCDLFTWHHPETNELKAWQLAVGNLYVEWSENRGLCSGSITAPKQVQEGLSYANLQSPIHAQDATIDPVKRQLAFDIVMAWPQTPREALLETFTE